MADTFTTSIGSIGNYYGDLEVKSEGGKFWWNIENWDGACWEEIPERLYRELIAFEEERKAAIKAGS